MTKKLICFLLISFLFANSAFAEWLGWKYDDERGKGLVMVFAHKELGVNASSPEDLQRMVQYGDAVLVDYGTQCYVLERTMGVLKLEL